MSVVLDTTPRGARRTPRRRAVWSVMSVRWAVVATILFFGGLVAQVAGAPTWLSWTLYLACYATGGWEPALEGLRALREKTLDVDLLMIVAAIGAAGIGQVFDGALLIVIFATSGALEEVATSRTEDSVRDLLDLAPDTAMQVDATGDEHTVDASDLVPGDEIIVRPGGRIAADGTVVDGTSDVDQSSITGEPLPVDRGVGDLVFAGTVNGTGLLRIRVTEAATDTVVARIASMVRDATATVAPTQLFIEKVERRYSVGVVVATLALFAVPLALGADFQSALLRAMTFMIVASPCAIVLATMPPLLSAMSTAGRNGVLVKSAVAMEKLADVDQVAFDKTGTLTTGTPSVTGVVPIGEVESVDAMLQIAAAAERGSEHPIGRAIVRAAAGSEESDRLRVEHFRAVPGRGVQALVDGRRVEVITASRSEVAIDAGLVAEVETGGATAVAVIVDDRPRLLIAIHDHLRPGAAASVGALARLDGRAPVLVTGDNAAAARQVGDEVGITDVRSGLLPHEKVSAITQLRERAGARIAVVGDGVNDAPALAAADVGVAMGGIGADLTLETSDVVMVRDDLSAIPAVLRLARRARRIVIANLVIAGTAIVVLVTWDLVGHLPLPLGVAGHEGSTILVALNGIRLLSRRAWR
ncbi:heavy metal translocating P-type ATPase [Gordonia soli]|uniref:Putative cation-transporting ATPase n=1 Tax=Gordonia soli NBRC 108243 TaxID=1223545 RepID=M0QNJ3_9ACTN|nr:heavy metal translocating P-type ATPase [Gordonia soli]GAC70143.1 putative cation-transporting ATPase [Gordonia soli NBRC 108243]